MIMMHCESAMTMKLEYNMKYIISVRIPHSSEPSDSSSGSVSSFRIGVPGSSAALGNNLLFSNFMVLKNFLKGK